MARSRDRGKEYGRRDASALVPGLIVLGEEDTQPPELKVSSLKRLLALAYFGWRLYRARERKRVTEKSETKAKAAINSRLDEPNYKGVTGIEYRKAGQQRSMKVQRVIVLGRNVKAGKAVEFLKALGTTDRESIVKGVHFDPNFLASHPKLIWKFLGTLNDEELADALEALQVDVAWENYDKQASPELKAKLSELIEQSVSTTKILATPISPSQPPV